jgi:1-acyl-sn-glycerol-3-phosphate acyltransferase
MAKYIMVSQVNAAGAKTLRDNPDRLLDIEETVRAFDGKIVQRYALLGKQDFLAVVDAPDNYAAWRIGALIANTGRVQTRIFPAIDLDVFVRLLGQTTETVGPYRWQISFPAQVARRALRWYSATRYVNKYCKPFEVEGRENLKGLKGPAIFIANHSSHMDAPVIVATLPERYRRRVAFGSAADRWFLKGRKGLTKQPWWGSLTLNNWPIHRGGGRKSLEYGEWLIDKGWSLMIFPEGTRSTTGKMGRFRHGVAMVALAKKVPVVPIYIEGLREIRPKGSKELKPGPVVAQVGHPIYFAEDETVSSATDRMYHAMDALRRDVHHRARPAMVGEPQAAL